MEIPDKSWMQISHRASTEYEEGINSFLDYAFGKLGHPNTIRCPYSKCCNVKFKTREHVKYDLFQFGILKSYTNWDHHGELLEENIDEDTDEEQGGMKTLLSDAFLQREDTQSNIHQEEYISVPSTYYNLLEDCRAEAYPGCTKYSRLSLLIRLLDLKKKNNWSDTSFTMLLEFLSNLLPEGSKIPKSYYEAKKNS
jgi:Transposase-associated domain